MHAYSNTRILIQGLQTYSSNVSSNRIKIQEILLILQLETDYFSKLFISEMLHSKQWHYSLHRDFQNCYSTRRSPTGFFKLQFQLQYYTPDSRNSTHRRQGDLLEMHPCVLHDIPGNSSCSRDIPDIPVIHDLPAFQAILQCSSISRESTPFQHSPIRMHILHILQFLQFDWFPQKTPPSTSWAITDITNITFKEREMLRYRSRCQNDIFPRIELIPSFVLSSDNTNCKNDIQLFHQLFDELSVHTDYH